MRALLLATGAPILFLLRACASCPRPTGFRKLRVAAVTPESRDVTSFALEPRGGRPAARLRARPVRPGRGSPACSPQLLALGRRRAPDQRQARRRGQRRPARRAARGRPRSRSARPQGRFTLDRDPVRPVVLLSAGIGATPVLAMLHALADAALRARGVVDPRRAQRPRARLRRRGPRPARAAAATRARTSPTAGPTPGDTGLDGAGRIDPATLERLGVPARRRVPPLRVHRLRPRPAGGPPCPRRHPPPQRGVRRPGNPPPPRRAGAGPRRGAGGDVLALRGGGAVGRRFAARPGRGERRPGAVGLPRRLLPRLPHAGARRLGPPRPGAARPAPARLARCCAARGRRATSVLDA